jgi:hypothetical protein
MMRRKRNNPGHIDVEYEFLVSESHLGTGRLPVFESQR